MLEDNCGIEFIRKHHQVPVENAGEQQFVKKRVQ